MMKVYLSQLIKSIYYKIKIFKLNLSENKLKVIL